MARVFVEEEGEFAALAQQVAELLNRADLSGAREANDRLLGMPLPPALRLFAIQSQVRLLLLSGSRTNEEPIIDELERAHGMLNNGQEWPQYWYLLAWLTIPLITDRRIDVYYLSHRSSLLPNLITREECLVQAVHYAVLYREHHFMIYIERNPAFSLDNIPDAYYRTKMRFLMAAYHRESSQMHELQGMLSNAASSPLQELGAKQLAHQFSHILPD